MDLEQAIALIKPAALSNTQPATWADLGCGSGLFTQALATLLPAGSTIHGVDTKPSLKPQVTPVSIQPIQADFIKDDLTHLGALDGILMANSFHYVKDKLQLIQKLRQQLNPSAPFLIVEYDTDVPVKTWVPYPISFKSLNEIFKHRVRKLGEHPSIYGRANMYAAICQ